MTASLALLAGFAVMLPVAAHGWPWSHMDGDGNPMFRWQPVMPTNGANGGANQLLQQQQPVAQIAAPPPSGLMNGTYNGPGINYLGQGTAYNPNAAPSALPVYQDFQKQAGQPGVQTAAGTPESEGAFSSIVRLFAAIVRSPTAATTTDAPPPAVTGAPPTLPVGSGAPTPNAPLAGAPTSTTVAPPSSSASPVAGAAQMTTQIVMPPAASSSPQQQLAPAVTPAVTPAPPSNLWPNSGLNPWTPAPTLPNSAPPTVNPGAAFSTTTPVPPPQPKPLPASAMAIGPMGSTLMVTALLVIGTFWL